MKNTLRTTLCAVALITTANAYALEKNIVVNATINSSVDLTMADKSPMPSSIDLNYIPGVGLATYATQVKLWSNDPNTGVSISLGNDTDLHSMMPGDSSTIPLAISLNGTNLNSGPLLAGPGGPTVTPYTLNASQLFPTGSTKDGSIPLEFMIKPTATTSPNAGQYQGVINLIIAQNT